MRNRRTNSRIKYREISSREFHQHECEVKGMLFVYLFDYINMKWKHNFILIKILRNIHKNLNFAIESNLIFSPLPKR